MIPKLICKIFGHIRHTNFYVGMTNADDVFGRKIPLMERRWNKLCPRCGAKL